jgi:membrane protein DedA with SNARE-associated domain
MHALVDWYLGFKQWYFGQLSTGGYPLIVLLMVMESSVVPIPSEVVVPQTAYLAHLEGRLSPVGIWLAATLGSLIGATIMYWGARWAGRPLVLRFGRFVLVSPSKLESAEAWCARFGPAGVFIARLVPVIRHLIGIPTGILRMNFWRYAAYTVAGSAVWCAVLTGVGVYVGNNPQEVHKVGAVVIVAALFLGGMYFVLARRSKVGVDPAV